MNFHCEKNEISQCDDLRLIQKKINTPTISHIVGAMIHAKYSFLNFLSANSTLEVQKTLKKKFQRCFFLLTGWIFLKVWIVSFYGFYCLSSGKIVKEPNRMT